MSTSRKRRKGLRIFGITMLGIVVVLALVVCKALQLFDFELRGMISETVSQFVQREYADAESGLTIPYNLYVPKDYDGETEYPLLLFITDSSVVGRDTQASLTQGYGGVIWATEEEQAKHPCFVVVPEFAQVIVDDDSGTTPEVEATPRLLDALTREYSVDTNRLYITGQSMGGMTALYLNKTYPDLFAASYLVACQWAPEGMEALKDSNIFYIVAEDDERASPGQDAIRDVLETAGAKITTGVISATDSKQKVDQDVQSLLDQGNNLIFVKYGAGTLFQQTWFPMAHMATWSVAYKIDVARDWLFQQRKS